MLIKAGALRGSVHELSDALSTQINHEIDELTLKKWFEEYCLRFQRYTPQWARESKDLFVTGSFISDENQRILQP